MNYVFFLGQMAEVKNTLEPLLKLVTENVLPPSPGVQYIKSKYQLILKYIFLLLFIIVYCNY